MSDILTEAKECKKRGIIVHPCSSLKSIDPKAKEIAYNACKAVLIKKWGTSKRHAGVVKGRELDLDFLKEFDREYEKSKNKGDAHD